MLPDEGTRRPISSRVAQTWGLRCFFRSPVEKRQPVQQAEVIEEIELYVENPQRPRAGPRVGFRLELTPETVTVCRAWLPNHRFGSMVDSHKIVGRFPRP
jgi:hypothetical protein